MRIIKGCSDGCQGFASGQKVASGSKLFAMNKIVTPEIQEVMDAVHYRPAVSIILPFEPKMNLKTELNHSLKTAADKVELELRKEYPEEMSSLVVKKL